jgi:hypothetical protein
MAQLGGTFDANQVDPAGTYEVLPPGDYKVQIVQSDMMNTKNGNGQYLWLEMDIVDGEHQGRKVWDRLNLVNPNQQAQEIAQKQLSAICHAIGVLSVQDSEELHFKTMLAKVKVKPRQDTGENVNEVSGYKPVDGQQQAAPAAGQQKKQPEMAGAGGGNKGGGSTPPWKR